MVVRNTSMPTVKQLVRVNLITAMDPFFFDLFTNTNNKMDLRTTLRIPGISNLQNLSLTWLITPNGQDDINIQVRLN